MDENMALTPYETREILFYKTDNGDVKVEILLYQENLWLTQAKMAELFEVQKAAISKHLKNIFTSGELMEDSVVSVLETTCQLPVKNINLMFFTVMGIASSATPIFFLRKRNKNKNERTVRTNGDLPLGSKGGQQRCGTVCGCSFRLSELYQYLKRL